MKDNKIQIVRFSEARQVKMLKEEISALKEEMIKLRAMFEGARSQDKRIVDYILGKFDTIGRKNIESTQKAGQEIEELAFYVGRLLCKKTFNPDELITALIEVKKEYESWNTYITAQKIRQDLFKSLGLNSDGKKES